MKIIQKAALILVASALSAGSAVAKECTIASDTQTGTVMANDWVAFFPESENAAVPKEYLITPERIFRDPSWRDALKTVTAPEGCESVIWTKTDASGQKIVGTGTLAVPPGTPLVSYMCRCK